MEEINIAYKVIGMYLIIGLVVLLCFDLRTKRLRTRLNGCTYEAQSKMANHGSLVGYRTTRIFLAIAIWMFWPVVLIGYLADRRGNE